MKASSKISAVIITLNEEKNIADCIKSLESVVDQIIVIDANSKDRTVDIAKELGAIVKLNDWVSFGNQKNFGASLANNDWILSIDADERLDATLKSALLNLELDEAKLYATNVKTNYLGKWIRYCGWYPNYKKRIYSKSISSWNDDDVHERLISKQKLEIINLPGNLLHYSYPSLERHHEKIINYAQLAAKRWKRQNRNPSIFKKLFGPSFRFLKTYIFRLGFLDGKEGYLISKMSAILVRKQLNYFKELN